MEAIKRLLKKHKTVVFLDFEGTQYTHEIIATIIMEMILLVMELI